MEASKDHVPIMRDWVPPSTDFTSMRNNDIASRSIAGFDSANRSGTRSSVQNIPIQSSFGGNNEASHSNALSGPRSSLSGGLVERMAARAGFNAPRLNMESIRPPELYTNPDIRSPYLTIPPGLSPTTLLESPVFLSNSMAFPSPTTGKFPFFPSGNSLDSSTMIDNRDTEGKTNTFEDTNASSYASFRGVAESPITHSNAANRSSFHNGEVYFRSEQQNTCPPKVNSENNVLFYQTNFSKSNAEDNGGGNLLMDDQTYYSVGVVENSPPFEDNSPSFEEQQQNDDVNQRVGDQDPNNGGGSGEDGYNWRKYGQKHVKGSEYPRSYYKCTQLNCPVKKKVERSHEGHITEIIYKGAHNHPKPSPNRRSVLGSANALSDVQLDSEQLGLGAASDLFWPVMPKGNTPENTNGGVTNMLVAQSGTPNEVGDSVEITNISNNDDDDRVTHGSVSLGQDGEGDESESKRRRTETSAAEVIGATRAIREPRVVVQTKSDVDILDDGYRWRKYGQKVVKGNPNPRSYYKCTSPGCNVRKHVERASHDLKSVITTYEGKHNHDVPAARNSNSGGPNNQQASISMNHLHRPKPCPVRGRSAWLERSQPSSYGLQGQQQVGSGFGFGMNGLASLGTHQGNLLPTFPVHAYAGNQVRPMNEMTYMLPKEELESERMMDSSLSSVVGSSVYYQQLMSQLPLGPQM